MGFLEKEGDYSPWGITAPRTAEGGSVGSNIGGKHPLCTGQPCSAAEQASPSTSSSSLPSAAEGGLPTGRRSCRAARRCPTRLPLPPATLTLDCPDPLPEAAGAPAPQQRAPHPSIAPAPGEGQPVFISQSQSCLLLAETPCSGEPARGRPDCPQRGRAAAQGGAWSWRFCPPCSQPPARAPHTKARSARGHGAQSLPAGQPQATPQAVTASALKEEKFLLLFK